jgi:triphosphoribosyl-dephospho-CoA synthase
MALRRDDFERHVTAAVATIPPACPTWGPGWCAALAGILEAAAAKPGNVHPGAAFPDLAFADLVAAAAAIAPPLEAAADHPLGETILLAARAARAAARSNANLGIILLLAPVARAAGQSTRPVALGPRDVAAVLAATGPADAAAIWEAIAIARPGGLGTSDRWDVAGPPPDDIRAAMRHAAGRDTIARLWAEGFDELFAGPVQDLAALLAADLPLEEAIILAHLRQLARQPDSLIARRHGRESAEDVGARAARLLTHERAPDWQARLVAFDASLRQPLRLNPGTTADLVAAALYILLLDGRLRPALPSAVASRPVEPPFTPPAR